MFVVPLVAATCPPRLRTSTPVSSIVVPGSGANVSAAPDAFSMRAGLTQQLFDDSAALPWTVSVPVFVHRWAASTTTARAVIGVRAGLDRGRPRNRQLRRARGGSTDLLQRRAGDVDRGADREDDAAADRATVPLDRAARRRRA